MSGFIPDMNLHYLYRTWFIVTFLVYFIEHGKVQAKCGGSRFRKLCANPYGEVCIKQMCDACPNTTNHVSNAEGESFRVLHCDSGECVIGSYCDGHQSCLDGTDERECFDADKKSPSAVIGSSVVVVAVLVLCAVYVVGNGYAELRSNLSLCETVGASCLLLLGCITCPIRLCGVNVVKRITARFDDEEDEEEDEEEDTQPPRNTRHVALSNSPTTTTDLDESTSVAAPSSLSAPRASQSITYPQPDSRPVTLITSYTRHPDSISSRSVNRQLGGIPSFDVMRGLPPGRASSRGTTTPSSPSHPRTRSPGSSIPAAPPPRSPPPLPSYHEALEMPSGSPQTSPPPSLLSPMPDQPPAYHNIDIESTPCPPSYHEVSQGRHPIISESALRYTQQ